MVREQVLGAARQQLEQGKPKEAEQTLSPYVRRYDGDAEGHALLAHAYDAQGLGFMAVQHMRHSLIVDEHQPELAKRLVRILMDLLRWEEALEVAEPLARDYPADKVLQIMRESCRENVVRPAVGWERDALPEGTIEFTNSDG